MAYSTVQDFLEVDGEEVSEVVVADINRAKLDERVREFGNPKLSSAYVDVRDHAGLVSLMKRFDVAINMTLPSGGYTVMAAKAALEAGIHIIDLGAWPEDTREQMKLNGEFRKADLASIMGLGSSPGISNLMARALIDKLDTVESVEISFAYGSMGKSTLAFRLPFLGAIDEFTSDAEILRDGKIVKLPPQSGMEDISYPDPIGVRRTFYIPHSEVATLSETFKDKGLKNISVRAGFLPEFCDQVNFLIRLGLISSKPLRVGEVTVIPEEVFSTLLANLPKERGDIKDYGCTRVVVRGEKLNEKIEYTAEMVNRPYKDLTGVQHRTGHSPSIGARMLCKDQIKERGVFPPEVGIDTKTFFRELAKRELEIKYTAKYII